MCWRRLGCRALLSALLLVAAGCAGPHPRLDATLQQAGLPASRELVETPFFPQEDYQCGPAALATVLVASGVEVTDRELAGKVYLPQREGSLQLELVAASRRHDRLPYPIDARLPALLAEINAGRPVLVLQNLGFESFPTWHYAVVIGYDAMQGEMILRSGPERRHTMSSTAFMRSWELADKWGLVLLRPGEMPAEVDQGRYLNALVAMEPVVSPQMRTRYYAGAAERWPQNSLALFGLANSYYAQGAQDPAESTYRELLAMQPGHAAARNNLAHLLAGKGHRAEAIDMLDRGLAAMPANDPLRESLLTTREEILASGAAVPPSARD